MIDPPHVIHLADMRDSRPPRKTTPPGPAYLVQRQGDGSYAVWLLSERTRRLVAAGLTEQAAERIARGE